MTTILFIEDEPYYQESYGEPLKQAGYTVQYVTNGKEAQKKLDAKKYDLIILDLIMPIMSGKRFLENLKKKKQTVIILTNLEGDTDREDCLAHGASAFLIKSKTSPKQLVEKIKKLLSAQKNKK